MITICPFCGHDLKKPLMDGIIVCSNCNRLFDNSWRNKMLAAAWMCRKKHVQYAIFIKEQYDLDDNSITLIQKYVIDEMRTHEEFLKVIDHISQTVLG